MTRIGYAAARRRLALAAGIATVALASNALSVAADHDLFRRISAGAINGNGAVAATYVGASADGTRVFFETTEGLVGSDSDLVTDIYERSAGTTKLISAGAINGNGAFAASFAGASADGTRVFFLTSEKLVSADTDAAVDLYQRSAGTTERISAGAINGNLAVDAHFDGASADGSKVFFDTEERLVSGDVDAETDIYQRSGGTTRRVSVGAINGNGAFASIFRGASADGTRVFFQTSEPLAGSDTDTGLDVYQRFGGTTKLISAGAINGNTPGTFAAFQDASADGTHVFFQSDDRLVAADTDSAPDMYERSAGTTKLVSAGAVNGNGAFSAYLVGASSDGARAYFETDEKLVTADTDSVTDVYLRSNGVTTLVSSGATNGNGPNPAVFVGASTDGSRVFFVTAEQLVSSDADAQVDVYQRSGGVTQRISTGGISSSGPYDSVFVGASADGTRVFFESSEHLSFDDGDSSKDLYERFGGVTTLLSPGDAATDATFQGSSIDGSRVFFSTAEKVLANDKDTAVDVYGAYSAP